MRTPLVLSTCLLGMAAAAEPVNPPVNPLDPIPVLGRLSEAMPGRQSAQRQVVVQGGVIIEGLRSYNATDADADNSDSQGYGKIRANLGLELWTDPDVAVLVGFGYHGRAGGVSSDGSRGPETSDSGDAGSLTLNRARVKIDSFLGVNSLSLSVGRTGIHSPFNMARPNEALLFDAGYNDRDVSGWDGAKLSWAGYENIVFNTSLYRLPDASTWWSFSTDWTRISVGRDRMFFSGSANLQTDMVLVNGQKVDKLTTWQGGASWFWGDAELFFDGAVQNGDYASGIEVDSYGLTGGVDWAWAGANPVGLGLSGTLLSGDNPNSQGTFEGFLNPYETLGQLYLFENETYGELLRNLVGDQQILRTNFSYSFDSNDTVGVDMVYGYARRAESKGDGAKSLGHEFDLTVHWKYRSDTTLRLFGAAVKPGKGLAQVLTGNDTRNDDSIYVFGLGATAKF